MVRGRTRDGGCYDAHGSNLNAARNKSNEYFAPVLTPFSRFIQLSEPQIMVRGRTRDGGTVFLATNRVNPSGSINYCVASNACSLVFLAFGAPDYGARPHARRRML